MIENQEIKNILINKRTKSSSNLINIPKDILPEKTQKKRKNSCDNKIENLNKNHLTKKNAGNENPELKEIKEKNNNEIKTEEEKLPFEKQIEIHETKREIALYLYNWLINLIESKEIFNKDESIHHSIEYIVKFISYTKELEIIFRIFLLLGSSKFENGNIKMKKYGKNIYNCLLTYLSSNSLFMQILIELLIHSYIYKNLYKKNSKIEGDDFIILSKDENNISHLKFNNFKLIYEKALEILLDIYFLETGNKRSGILSKIFHVSLKLLLIFQDSNDVPRKKLLLKFVNQMFIDINEIYNKKNSYKKYYLEFFTFFMDFCFIFKNMDAHLQKIYEEIKDDRTNCLPDFLIHGLIYDNENGYHWAGYDVYLQIFSNIKRLFSIKNIFEQLEIIQKDVNQEKQKQKYIFPCDLNCVKSLINDIIYNKNKDEYQHSRNIDAFFYSYKNEGFNNNFPIINIISLFLSFNLYLFNSEINNPTYKEKFLPLIKDIHNYIIFLIIISLIIKPNDYQENLEEYDGNQILIYKNLFFMIQNILYHLKDELNKKYYLEIIYNIMLFLSVLFNIEQNEKQNKKNKSFFKKNATLRIDINKIAPKMLNDFYIKKNDNILNEKNFLFFIEGNKEKNMKLFHSKKLKV